ncbi:MAG: Ig-like domain-containing protein [Bacteroidales bacterium]|jgi:uncharacterized protein YjdB|nr:Ig-like domain-containing protein [Bacteroidales bacterium]
MKKITTFLISLMIGVCAFAQLTFDDIELWAGEGSNRAGLAVQWNDPRETNAMVWGYQWDGDAYGFDILVAVSKADPKFYVFADYTGAALGNAIAGIGYDANGDGVFFIKRKSTGELIYPNEDGILPHPNSLGYDYDDYEAGDPEDYWGAGWYSSYWSYWVGTSFPLSYSGLGASSRKLTDGCWDGWSFNLGMGSYAWKEFIPAPADGYTAGTFILSNDNQNSILSFLDKKGVLSYNIYGAANASAQLPENTYNSVVFGSSIYIVSDEHLLIADAKKLTLQTDIEISGGRSFVGVNAEKGYVGTNNGIYTVDLKETPSLGQMIAGTDAETGVMLYSNGYVFAIQKDKGVVIINTSTNTIEKTVGGDYLLLTQSSDGAVWAGAGVVLTKINPATLTTENIAIPANAALSNDWNEWNSKLFFADVTSSTLYWINSGYTANSNSVFQYNIGQPASLESPLFSLPHQSSTKSNQSSTKISISMNYMLNQLTVSADKIYMVDVSNGDVLSAYSPELNGDITNVSYTDMPAKINIESKYTVALNSEPLKVSLSGKISDPDNLLDNITIAAVSDNEVLVTVMVANDTLVITPQAGESGSAKITVFATSNGAVSKKNIDFVVTRSLENIAFAYTEKTINRGSKDTLNVVFTPENATNKTLVWTRKSNKVSVSNGIVTASSAGNDTVVATSADGGFVAWCAYTVTDDALESISFNKKAITLSVGKKDTITVSYFPANVYNKNISWTQNPTGILTTSFSTTTRLNVLTGSKAGTTVLVGKSSQGGFTDTCIVTVVFDSATSLALNADTIDLTVPATFALKGAFSPSDASNTKITWTSRNTAIATVNISGTVTSVAAGETYIIAMATDDSTLMDSTLVRVDFTPVTEFSIAIGRDTTIGVGTSIYATTTFTPSTASSKTIVWTSSNTAVATVSASGASGYIRGISKGTAWIYAVTNGTFKDSLSVTVDSIHVASFVINQDVKEVWKKTNSNIWNVAYTILPGNATNRTVKVIIQDTTVVGLYSPTMTYLTPRGLGDSKVYLYAVDGGITDSCLVHVVQNVASVTLDIKDTSLTVGDVITLNATVLPENSIQTLTYTSSDKSVADVDANGNITALKAGSAIIIAASADIATVKDTCYVAVNNQIAESVVLGATSKALFAGDNWTVGAEVLPTNTTNKRLRWTSSDYSVADVDANGAVKAIEVGSATITAYTKDGGTQQSCIITVENLDYTSGVFFVNEDWFGHSNGSLNFLTSGGQWVYNVYRKENPGKELGATSQYGTIYGDKFYIVSKQEKDPGASVEGSRLAVCNASTLKSLKEFTAIGSADGRAFLGVSEHKGYISTSDGVYVYSIDSMSIGGKIAGTDDQTGAMLRVGNRVFAANQSKGILVINAETDVLETVVRAPIDGTAQRGYGSIALSKNGDLWCSVTTNTIGNGDAEDYLIKLDPWTLDTVRIALPSGYAVPNSWYAWTADGFCSSKQQNKLYWQNAAGWFNSTKIYSYDIDAMQAELVFDLADYDDGGWGFYGAGFRIDPVSDDIYASLFRSFGEAVYRTVRISPITKTVVASYQMDNHYWFPAMPVFPDNFAPVAADIQDTNVTELQSFSISLKDIAADDDNLDAAIVTSVTELSNSSVLDVQTVKDGLIVTPKTSGECMITVRFNSNGKTVDKMFTVTVSIAVGTDAATKSAVSVYPNPFADYVIVSGVVSGVAGDVAGGIADGVDVVTIYDLQGRVVLSVPFGNGNNRINTSALPKGIYVLKAGANSVKIVK